MKLLLVSLLTFCLIQSKPAWACLWIHGTTLDGRFARSEGFTNSEKIEDGISERPEELKQFHERFAYDPDSPVARLNDLAVQALLRGESEAALTALEKIEASHPGEYMTAANRGSVLELLGRDEEALTWIKEGIRRNPDSHMRAEWLHAKILEAKLKMKAEPTWLDTNWICGLDKETLASMSSIGVKNAGYWATVLSNSPKSSILPSTYMMDTAQGKKSLNDVKDALLSQVLVRVLFVKPEDKVMAQLLWELAQIESRVGFLEEAIRLLELAGRYGKPVHALQTDIDSWQSTITWSAWMRSIKKTTVFVLFGAAVYGFILLLRYLRALRE
jgi:tetratricopeptide (TPR) repeat protein